MINKELYIFCVLFIFNNVAGSPSYSATIEGISCDDLKNEQVSCDGIKVTMTDDGKGVTLGGYIEFLADITEDMEISLSVVKEMENGNQHMFSIVTNFCVAVEDEKALWAKICKDMNMTACPVRTGKYELEDVTMKLDEKFLDHSHCGDYKLQIIMMNGTDVKGCINAIMAINEVNNDK